MTVTGSTLTATMLVVLGGLEGTAYRISIGLLAVIMSLGILLLARVPDARPAPTVEEFAPVAHVK